MKITRKKRLLLAVCAGLAGWSHAATETETFLGRGYAAYEAGHYEEAAAAFRGVAEKGHAGAMLSLAQMYHKGQGLPQDDALALQWYVRAAEKGNQEAMNSAARAYELGLGTAKNAAQSVKWYLQSAASGDAEGMFMAGRIHELGSPAAALPADSAQALAWYEKARDAGNEEALPRLLRLSLPAAPVVAEQQGLTGSRERAQVTALALARQGNVGDAFKWWYYAAARGETNAMYNLGLLYFRGWGTRKNDVEALRWWLAAAESGNAAAMVDLGVMQENAWGLGRDFRAARYWYQRAGKNGFASAPAAVSALDIRELLERGWAAEGSKSWAEARNCFEQAVKIGSVEAMTALGVMYENGWGVARDGDMAVSWYQKAVAANNAEAMFRLGMIYQEAHPGDPAATALYRQAADRQGDSADVFWRDSALRRLQEISMAKATPRFRREYQAASTGDERAMLRLGEFYDQGLEGVAQNREEAFRWWQASAARGYPAGMTLTGLRYLSAVGVRKDAPKGLELLGHAALLGNLEAMAALVDVYRKGDEGIPAEQRKSTYWLDRYTAAQRLSRQVRDEEMQAYVSHPEQQSHAYLLRNDADYAARFSAPVRPAGYRVLASRVLPSPLNLWDAGSGQYLPVQEIPPEKAQDKKSPEKTGAEKTGSEKNRAEKT
ncbi:MAG: tetratricopeptide repeat protein [bacterium]|nr:tetratricopeptide repeat protein [bacterium]